MASAEVPKQSAKWLSSSSSRFKTKNLKLSSIPSRLKRSFSSSSSSSLGTPRNTTTPPLSPLRDNILSAKERNGRINSNKEDRFKEVFRYFDGDGDGKISSLELRSYFESIGEYLSHDEVQSVINDLDSDGDGLLGFQDFMVLMMKQPSSPPSSNGASGSSTSVVVDDNVEDLKMAFEMYEAEKGCGCITPKSLQRMLNRLGEDKSYQQCVSMIQCFDLDKNGTLDFHEFHQMMV
ncbi:hypothetical protein C5167_000898 [Papaver somniferum]|uniref:EF-hand domain-containing protein n=1 Tax=Papaver somniferum TaxID=3469 RepID=A0A4Y7KUX3_PAPSO|nr:probable calcium-binding protein CML41 [Papaver somniferum]RZC75968.1 hypothetical protein C5167_000898 [Papaver somniferum]